MMKSESAYFLILLIILILIREYLPEEMVSKIKITIKNENTIINGKENTIINKLIEISPNLFNLQWKLSEFMFQSVLLYISLVK